MKKYISLLIIAVFTFVSCDDYLDKTPKGTLIPKTINDFGMMLDEATMGTNGYLTVAQFEPMLMDDDFQVPADKKSLYNSWAMNGYTWEDYLFGVNEGDREYNQFYRGIYICNYIIENVESAPAGSQYTREYVEGSARFTRAYAYLCLVNTYAKHYDASTASSDLGVALILDADPNQTPRRATIQEVYDQIIEDATRAESLLTNESEYTFRPTKAGACGLLARIYLYMGDYAKCLEYARKARGLVHEPTDYNQFSVMMINPELGLTGWPGYFYYSHQYPDVVAYKGDGLQPLIYQDYNLSDELAAMFKDNDLRRQLFMTTCASFGFAPGAQSLRIAGYLYPNNHGINVGDIYIMNAEAACRIGQVDEALECLNALGVKRHVTGTYENVTERDADKLLRLILDERRRENLLCGTRLTDLKRLNKDPRFAKTITHVLDGKTYTLTPDDPHYVLPIPLNVIDRNPNMEQNPR